MVSLVLVFAFLAGVCLGAPNPDRIVGGTPINVSAYPHIAQVERNWGPWVQICGGTILANHILLSAAHCFDLHGVGTHNYRVRAGATYRSRGGSVHYINQVIIHPSYGVHHIAADADICIVRMRDHFVYGHYVQPIPILPQDFVIPHNSQGVHAGWGQQGSHLGPPDQLHHVHVNIVSHADCERRYGGPIHTDVVCAGYNGRGTCFGDSGGPLYFGTVLAGVVSWGPEICAHPYRPGASIRTASYTNWILANAW